MRRLYIVPERFAHHVAESSPDQLAAHLDPYELFEAPYERLADAPEALLRGAGPRPNIRTAYNERAFCRELALIEAMRTRKDMLVHFLNGESACYLSPRYKGENKIVAVYHQPPSFMETIIPDKSHFPLHDAVVVVAPNQTAYFEKITGPGKVRCIPLGVETGFFPFGPFAGRKKRVLFVGNWLRDFYLLAETLARIARIAPDIELLCVTPAKNHAALAGEGIRLLTGLSVAELTTLYATSSVFLHPVADCTANTALLEAMACGTPVVANARAFASGYLSPDMSLVVPDGDAGAMTGAMPEVMPSIMADACIRLCRDAPLARRMSEAARQWAADRFDWARIAPLYAELYASLGADIRVR